VQKLLSSKNIKITIFRTIILPVALYGHETWILTLKEDCRLRVLSIFGPKRDEVTGEWRKLHNEELNDQYSGSGGGAWTGLIWLRIRTGGGLL
jgi:hypothetical protein